MWNRDVLNAREKQSTMETQIKEEITGIRDRIKRRFLRCKQCFKEYEENVSKTSKGEHFMQRIWHLKKKQKHK